MGLKRRQAPAIIIIVVVTINLFASILNWQHSRSLSSLNEITSSKGNRRLCDRDQLRRGTWSSPQHNASPPYIAQMPWERDTCYDANHSQYYHTEWVVDDSSCHLTPWSPQKFCDTFLELVALQQKPSHANDGKHVAEKQTKRLPTILFVGDSIAWQQIHSLKYLLWSTRNTNSTHQTAKAAERVSVCDDRVHLAWERSNYLGASAMRKALREHQPHVLVANRGAWFKPDETFVPSLNETLQVIHQWQEESVTPSGDRRTVVWRTTVPGMPGCDQDRYHPGNASLQAMEARVADISWYNQSQKRQHFHWWEFSHQNDLVEGMIGRILPHARFLDAYDWNMRRPDFHILGPSKDCLHYCLPGVPDETNRMLLHLLQRVVHELEQNLATSTDS